MDKIAKVPHLREELDWLDQTYGVEKEGFFHQKLISRERKSLKMRIIAMKIER